MRSLAAEDTSPLDSIRHRASLSTIACEQYVYKTVTGQKRQQSLQRQLPHMLMVGAGVVWMRYTIPPTRRQILKSSAAKPAKK